MTDQSINEQVALKLGYVQVEDQSIDPGGEKFKTFKRGDDVRCVGSRYPLPDYSHSIEAAWEIVEKYKVTVAGEFILRWTGTEWCAGWNTTSDEDFINGAFADTAPMAICKAFLKLPEDGK